jgi:glycosyltransferase involved in cell wall biosynthesis
MTKSVLFIAHRFPPRSDVGVYRAFRFVKELSKRGYDITVLTVREKDIRSAIEDPPKDYSLLNELSESVKIIRTPSLEAIGFKKLMMRLRIFRLFWFIFYPFFFEPSACWLFTALPESIRWSRNHPGGLIYSVFSPFSAIIIGILTKMFTGVHLIIDFRDPYTDYYIWSWPSKFHWGISKLVEKITLKKADAVIANTPTAKELFVNKGAKPEKVYTLPNGFDEIKFTHSRKEKGEYKKNNSDVLYISYGGSLKGYTVNDLEVINPPRDFWKKFSPDKLTYKVDNVDETTKSGFYLLRGVRRCCDKFGFKPENFYLDFFGSIDKKNYKTAENFGVEKSLYIGEFIPKKDALARMNSADVLFLPLESSRSNQKLYKISAKLYEYMALGKPILVLAEPCDGRTIAERSGLGIACDPKDPEAIADTLNQLYKMKQENCLDFEPNWNFIMKFSLSSLTDGLERVFESVWCKKSSYPDFNLIDTL